MSAVADIFVEDWAAGYGSPYLVAEGEAEDGVAALVEDGAELRFHDRSSAALEAGETLAFVDGVRRGEALLSHRGADGAIARGVAGAHACGAVVCRAGARAEVAAVRLRRLVIWGSGVDRPLPPAREGIAWEAHSVAGEDPDAPRRDLQDRMRDAETRLAERLAGEGHLVVLDGPLFYRRPPDLPVAGYVKTHSRRHLPPADHARVPGLGAGQRTSLFTLGNNRYSCYLRLAAPGPLAGPWSGIVRLEVPAGAGRAAAVRMVDRLAALLPGYAGVAHRDPRAPQNLQPVGALESRLRHLLGHRGLCARAVREAVDALHRAAAA